MLSRNYVKVMAAIGNRLREAREEAGLSRKEAAAQIGVDYYTIARYENNELKPREAVLKLMALLYGCSKEWLNGLASEKEESELVTVILTRGEWDLVKNYRGLSKDAQQVVDGITKVMLQQSSSQE